MNKKKETKIEPKDETVKDDKDKTEISMKDKPRVDPKELAKIAYQDLQRDLSASFSHGLHSITGTAMAVGAIETYITKINLAFKIIE